MPLFVLGTSQSVSTLGMRERMHVDLHETCNVLSELRNVRGVLDEALPLATCGRMEIYGVTSDLPRVLRVLYGLTSRATAIPRDELRRHTYVLTGHEAVVHLLRVASGLESVVHGEVQILGQVRDALEYEGARSIKGPLLHRLFQRAITTGKRVRTETSIGRGAASLASASLKLLRGETAGLSGLRTLVLGAGDTGRLIAQLLAKEGVENLTVANRTPERAESLARELGCRAADLADLSELLPDADLVIGAVTAPGHLIGRDEVAALGESAPRHFLDLAHPRNFDPTIDEVPGVRVIDLQHVFARVEEARASRAAQVPHAETIVTEEAAVFRKWICCRGSTSVVRSVRSHVLELAETEANRYARGLSEEACEALHRMARSLARRMLHTPTVALREADPETQDGRRLLESASVLFGVEGDDASTEELE